MDNIEFISLHEREIPIVQRLSKEIWNEYYPGILSQNQIDYMLDWMYSRGKIIQELLDGVHWEIILFQNVPVGYFSLKPTMDHFFISKLYLQSNYRGKGISNIALERIKSIAKNQQINRLQLHVNVNNMRAIGFYEKIGFQKIDTLVTEIGNDFIMDDYVYQYTW